MSHAVARLRAERLARSTRVHQARGARCERCERCRLASGYCACAWRPAVPTRTGACLLMHDTEPLKPTNTGWLVADVVADTHAFPWSRTGTDPRLSALLADPQWQPFVVFPSEAAAPSRRVAEVRVEPGRRPLLVLLDATWPQARRMFRKSPCLDGFPVLGLQPRQRSRYRLRRARHEAHLCTAEVAALCLRLCGEEHAADALDAWLDLFVSRGMDSRFHRGPAAPDEARLAAFQPAPLL